MRPDNKNSLYITILYLFHCCHTSFGCVCEDVFEAAVKNINSVSAAGTLKIHEWICQEMNVESYWLQNIFVSYPFSFESLEMINCPEDFSSCVDSFVTKNILRHPNHTSREKKERKITSMRDRWQIYDFSLSKNIPHEGMSFIHSSMSKQDSNLRRRPICLDFNGLKIQDEKCFFSTLGLLLIESVIHF